MSKNLKRNRDCDDSDPDWNPNNSVSSEDSDFKDSSSDQIDRGNQDPQNQGSRNQDEGNRNKGVNPCPRSRQKKIKKTIPIDTQINNLSDLIKLAEIYDKKYDYDCVIDIKTLNNMIEPLKKLNEMIGMEKFKNSLINQIIFQLTSLRDDRKKGEPQMLHTVLLGPPGSGKTELSKIFGELYTKMGILSSGHFVVAKRADLVAKYLGQTAPKTLKVLESARGGVLLIDEVYSLGPSAQDDNDSFSKECIDTINQFLSENADDFICIIAGYKEEVERCFFSRNPGLPRRFPYRYTIEGYNPNELLLIFQKFINDSDGWSLASPEVVDTAFFQTNKDAFPCYGGDLKVFFDNCKIAHARRTFILTPENWKKLTREDINKGFESYHMNKELGVEKIPESVRRMYM